MGSIAVTDVTALEIGDLVADVEDLDLTEAEVNEQYGTDDLSWREVLTAQHGEHSSLVVVRDPAGRETRVRAAHPCMAWVLRSV